MQEQSTPLRFDARRHQYFLDGEPVPSVTQILGIIRKPGLEKWRGSVGNTEADRLKRQAADHGTQVHKACELVAKGQDTLIAYPAGIIEPAEAFYSWFNANVRRVLASEAQLYNRLQRYAGTVDLVVELLDGTIAVADIKTGRKLGPEVGLQLAAYHAAMPSAELDLPQDAPVQRIAIHLPRDRPGHLEIVEYRDVTGNWRAFLAAKRLYDLFGGER